MKLVKRDTSDTQIKRDMKKRANIAVKVNKSVKSVDAVSDYRLVYFNN